MQVDMRAEVVKSLEPVEDVDHTAIVGRVRDIERYYVEIGCQFQILIISLRLS